MIDSICNVRKRLRFLMSGSIIKTFLQMYWKVVIKICAHICYSNKFNVSLFRVDNIFECLWTLKKFRKNARRQQRWTHSYTSFQRWEPAHQLPIMKFKCFQVTLMSHNVTCRLNIFRRFEEFIRFCTFIAISLCKLYLILIFP